MLRYRRAFLARFTICSFCAKLQLYGFHVGFGAPHLFTQSGMIQNSHCFTISGCRFSYLIFRCTLQDVRITHLITENNIKEGKRQRKFPPPQGWVKKQKKSPQHRTGGYIKPPAVQVNKNKDNPLQCKGLTARPSAYAEASADRQVAGLTDIEAT